MGYKEKYERWVTCVKDQDLLNQLKTMSDKEQENAFFCDLVFGTGGLRGIIGAGTNRMNIYTVGRASQGLSVCLKRVFEHPSVVIGYDTRVQSDAFSAVAAEVFAANGVKVHLWGEPLPVSLVSYAVRELGASAGIMITASHNPAKYNGYKVYGADGCQITTEEAKAVFAEISKIDIFEGIQRVPFDLAVNQEMIDSIDVSIYKAYMQEVEEQSVLYGDPIDRNVAIVYSPLNGTGLKPVISVLEGAGFTRITVVKEQRNPDGFFPTCPNPNPEMRDAMELGLEYSRRIGADLFVATDPDCDRCGIAVRDKDDYRLLTGNEVGILLLDYICSQRVKHGKMPLHPFFVKTIVTMDLATIIANSFGVKTINVLTGFKYIGEMIGRAEAQGCEKSFILGFEESYGYLTGAYVRDKDGVNAAYLICEMFAFYKTRGTTLIRRLKELYAAFGYCLNTLHSYEFPGIDGMMKMAEIMNRFHVGLKTIGTQSIIKTEDYRQGLNGLPKSNVIKYYLESGSVVIRPSGTEPKLKVYISVTADDEGEARLIERTIGEELYRWIKT